MAGKVLSLISEKVDTSKHTNSNNNKVKKGSPPVAFSNFIKSLIVFIRTAAHGAIDIPNTAT